MGIKDSLHSLEDVEALSGEHRTTLVDAHLGTVEEVLGAVQAEPKRIGQLINTDRAGVERLREALLDSLEPPVRAAFESGSSDRSAPPPGAWNPEGQ